jgi:hypothetical protein
MSISVNDCSCNGGFIPTVVQCKSCGNCDASGCQSCTFNNVQWIAANQKKIQNQVRNFASLYPDSYSALSVRGPFVGSSNNNPVSLYFNVNWNQSSDRSRPGIVTTNVPSRGNSTRYSITRERPGAISAGGPNAKGVDIKHNSYARYMARKKAQNIRQTPKIVVPNAQAQAYYTKYSFVTQASCSC